MLSVMVNTILDDSEVDEDQLDQFFLLLRYFNLSEPIDRQIVHNISQFMQLRWKMSKNSFIDDPIGASLLTQLP